MDNCKKTYIVRTSKNNFYYFFIKDKALIAQTYENATLFHSMIIQQQVQDYSLDIDKKDKIHITCLTNYKLFYLTYPEGINHQITHHPIKDNSIIKGLIIKVVNSSIHLFYQFHKSFFNRSFLYHSYLYDNQWHHIQLKEVCIPEYITSFYIDYYQDELYLLYCHDLSCKQYELMKFSFDYRNWCCLDNNIILSSVNSVNNLNFFITPMGDVILTFNEIVEKNLQVSMKYKNLKNSQNTWCSNINISSNNTNALRPISFYENGFTYILWTEEKNIICAKSTDFKKWNHEYLFDFNAKVPVYRYLSNHVEDKNYKCSNSFTNLFQSTEFHSNRRFITNYEPSSLESAHPFETTTSSTIITSDLKSPNVSIEYFSDELKKLQYENDKLFRFLNEYRNKYNTLKAEKEALTIDTNRKIKTLLKIIEDKNSIISILMKLSKTAQKSDKKEK